MMKAIKAPISNETTYRLVQHDLSLIQLLLDLHDAVGLAGVLILDKALKS